MRWTRYQKRHNDHAGVLGFYGGEKYLCEHRSMARLYQEVSAILQVFAKKGIPILIGPSVLNGILPGSKAK